MRPDLRLKTVNASKALLLSASCCPAGCGERQDHSATSSPAADFADLALLNGGIYTVDADRSKPFERQESNHARQ